MKKLFTLCLTVMTGILVHAAPADRAHTLKVYNWQDYIDIDNVLNTFPDWYREQTGEEVIISYQTFDINEAMLTQIEMGHEDYDLICPSEYIIERMLRQGLLLKIDKNFGNTPDYTKLVAPFVIDKFEQMSDSLTVSDYTVGYMWGTTGWLYNPKWVDEKDLHSWSALLNPKFAGRIFMKDAVRDVYSVLVLYAYREEIAHGEVTMEELVKNITTERMQRVEDILVKAQDNVAGWEVDFGKEEMTKGNAWMNLSWSGDAQWAIDESKEMGVTLRYTVPEDGSNVWFDGWCIPKYAVNTKAASYFINYMCMPQNAIYNMEEIGYVSVIASPEIMEWCEDEDIEETADLTYFFGEGADSVHANQVFYPDRSVINRCFLMHDCGDKMKDMMEMWQRVRGDNLSSKTIIFIVAVVAAVIIITIVRVITRRRQRYSQKKSRKKN